MKYIASLLLLPSIMFAGKIGENYLGVGLGASSIDFKYADSSTGGTRVSTDANDFSFNLRGNYNLYESGSNYGVDIPFFFFNGSGADSSPDSDGDIWKTDTDFSVFSLGLRPHYSFGNFKVFADLGLLSIDIETKINWDDATSANSSSDGTKFNYGFGVEIELSEKLSIQPIITWSETEKLVTIHSTSGREDFSGDDLISFTIPFAYSYSDKIDITASYMMANLDEFKNPAGDMIEIEKGSWSIGVDYKF